MIARSSAGGTANFRLFDVGSGSSLTLRGLTLSNGFAEGGHSIYGGGALGAGGAIFNQGTLTLDRCTLTGNIALGGMTNNDGGAGGGGTGALSSTSGGGPNGGAAGPPGSFTAGSNGGFGGGGGSGGGGGFAIVGTGGNGGFGGGGGQGGNVPDAAYGSGGSGGNGGFGGGGGSIGRAGGGLPIGNRPSVTPRPTNGIGGFGGGLGPSSSGGGAGMGGAIFNDAGTVMLTNSTLTANAANGGGNNSNVPGSGSGYGGAIFNYAGSVTLDFVSLTGNSVASGTNGAGGSADGGAIYSLGDSPAGCNAGGNACNTSGNATLMMTHSIAASSTGAANVVVVAAINGGSSSGSGSYNAIDATAGFTASNAVSGTLLLGALPATLTGGMMDVMIPQTGSAAIDAAGAAPCSQTIDQRGIARPQGAACDVGAVEVVTAVNQATLTAIATPASIVFNATSALSTTGGSGTGAVSFAVTAGNTFCSIVGSTLTGTGVGTCTVTATKAADANYNATTGTVNVPVGTADQAALVTIATPSRIVFNATSALTATGGSGTGAVSFAVTAGNSFCSIVGSTLTGTGVGTCSVTATKAADANYAATSGTSSVIVGAADQAALTATAAPSSIVFNATSALSTTGGSGTGAVSFAVTAGNTFCSVSSSTLTGIGVGTCTVTATKAADANYNATTATVNVSVGAANQAALTAVATPSSIVFSTTSALSTTGGSGTGAASFTVTAGNAFCSVTGSTLTGTSVGTCTVTATKAADANYNATTATVNVSVGRATQATLTAAATPASIVFNATSALNTTGGSGTGAVSFAVTAGNAFCSVSSSTLTGIGVGTCTVTATKAADANYNATTATVNVSVGVANQAALTAVATPASIVFNATSALSTTGGSGTGAVSFAVTVGNAFCSINGGVLTGTGIGTCTVTATKAPDANYNAASPVTATVVVGKGNQTITGFAPTTPVVFGAAAQTLTATPGASSSPLVFSLTSGPCVITSASLNYTGAGSCVVAANQAADANYNAASPVTATVVVGKANQTISGFVPTTPVAFGAAAQTLTATPGASSSPLAFSVTSGPCSLAAASLSYTGAGSCVIAVNQAADANYNAASPVTATVVVGKAYQVIVFGAPPSIVVGGTGTVAATGGLSQIFH